MNKKSRESVSGFGNVKTVLGKETSLNGDMKFKDSLKICGRFEGKIETKGYLEIAETAEIKADVIANQVKISGTLNGNVLDSDRIEMNKSAVMKGNIKTASLKIDDGVKFEGKCEMKK